MVVGYEDRPATPDELVQMQHLVSEAMRQGALAFPARSNTLRRPTRAPRSSYALSRAAAEYGGIYATHMRSEQEAIMTSLEETIRIGREAHIPVEIWHLKRAASTTSG